MTQSFYILVDRNKPTESFLMVTRYILPTCGGLLGAVIVGIIIISCLCRKACLQCYIKINRQGAILIAVDKKVDLHLDRLRSELSGEGDVQGGPPPTSPKTRCENLQQIGKKFISYLRCSETEEERETREKVMEIKRLLERNQQNIAPQNGHRETIV